MMPTEHDEALVERVALEMCKWKYGIGWDTSPAFNRAYWLEAARAIIYPPAPPKTRLQVARELLAAEFDANAVRIINPDCLAAVEHAVVAALALPAMDE